MAAAASAPSPPGPGKTLEAEHRISIIRLLVIVFNSVVYAALLPRDVGVPALAWTIIAVANTYGLYLIVARPYRRWPAMATAQFTTWTDGALITAWLVATGGFASPFYLLWYLSLVAVAFRFNQGGTWIATGLYAALYVALVAGMGQLRDAPAVLLVRVGYIGLVGALGALLAGDSTRVWRERAEMEERVRHEERFRVLVDAAFEGICLHEGGRILEVNSAIARITGRSQQELLGANVLTFVAPESAEAVERRLREPRDEPDEVFVLRPDGTRVVVLVQGRDVPFEGRTVRLAAVWDVTALREAEEARRRAAQQTEELDRLSRLNAMKAEFINTAAHEINTPLTPIKMQLHLLLRGEGRTEKEVASLRLIDRNLDRLAHLVRDMLDGARMQGGGFQLDVRDVDVDAVVGHVVATVQPSAQERGVSLEGKVSSGLTFQADPHRVEQVLWNLLSNAIKFTSAGGSVTLEARREGAEVVLRVTDTGAGLTQPQLESLFQPFTRHHGHLDQSGTGLGLYISRNIVEAHGGSLHATSPGPDKGATFTARFPVASAGGTLARKP